MRAAIANVPTPALNPERRVKEAIAFLADYEPALKTTDAASAKVIDFDVFFAHIETRLRAREPLTAPERARLKAALRDIFFRSTLPQVATTFRKGKIQSVQHAADRRSSKVIFHREVGEVSKTAVAIDLYFGVQRERIEDLAINEHRLSRAIADQIIGSRRKGLSLAQVVERIERKARSTRP